MCEHENVISKKLADQVEEEKPSLEERSGAEVLQKLRSFYIYCQP